MGDKDVGRPEQVAVTTSVVGNALSIDDQRRKLRLVCEVAERVWG